MNIYKTEGFFTLFKSRLMSSSAVKIISDKNAINILNSFEQNEAKKMINSKMISNHLYYNSSVKRYNILNRYFDFQSFSDEDKAHFIFKCLFINNPNILKKSLSLLNDSVLEHFKNSFVSNFQYINLKCNLSPHFYLLKEVLSPKQFKEIEPYLLYIVTYDSKVHFSSLFSQALSADGHPHFQKKIAEKIYENLSKERYFNSVLNIDFFNPDFYEFYLKNNILKSHGIFRNIILHSKQDTTPYFEFLASHSVLDNLIKENRGYFFNELQTRVRDILRKPEISHEKKNIFLKEAIDNFLKPLHHVSKEKTIEIFDIYFEIYKNSAMYIPDNKEVIDEYYKNILIDKLNIQLQKEHIDKNNFSFDNFSLALQKYTSLKEKELITNSISSNLHSIINISPKRI